MLIGATGVFARGREKLGAGAGSEGGLASLGSGGAIVVVRPWSVAGLDAEERTASNASTGSWLALSGHVFRDLASGQDGPVEKAASSLLARLDAVGTAALAEIDGSFALAFFDGRARRLHLVRDRFGVEPLFYGLGRGGALFGSRTRDLIATGLLPGGICPQGLAEFLTYCFIPGDATLDAHIRRVPPGHFVVLDEAGNVIARERWYRLSFAGAQEHDEHAIAERFRTLLEQAVVRRLRGTRPGALLSGGMDSSSVVTFARRHREGPILSYAFRCGGQGFDESIYARALAEAMGTEHTEVSYGEEQAFEIERAVAEMDAPFCDVGINVGTWILGKAAAGHVDFALTGDGGDELWASHPVYAAQRLIARYERLPIPRGVDRGLRWLGSRFRDSDHKRDLRVVAKRLLPHPDLPRELGPFRWRCYYVPNEMLGLVSSATARELAPANPFKSVIDAYDGYDGPDDGISPYLYNDYVTASSFYMSRLLLLRRFGIEARSPFYDRELVEYGTRIPASKKLEGMERTKRLFRQAMEGVLPDVINHRKDKLGHSVPMKLWLRGDGPLARRVAKILSPDSLRARGLFRAEPVQRLLEEHRARRHNHSHRLWALYVLELWLRAREGSLDVGR
jgi:asparagine synthase (glutamine-hydrolysing)